MSEYWKSIPKIYCKFCNVWYQDNKSSRDFHERSFKHKNNISRHIADVQKRGREKQKEEDEFKVEMQRIERAAMAKYLEKDVPKSDQTSTSIADQKERDAEKARQEQLKKETSDNLREAALEAITSKLKKKHEWFESKTIEGKIYFYNRLTMGKFKKMIY